MYTSLRVRVVTSRLLWAVVAGSLVLVLAACGSDGDQAQPETTSVPTPPPTAGGAFGPEPVSFERTVEPIISDVCARCHTGTGPGTPHLRMDTAGAVADAAGDIALLVGSGIMPPWPASDESVAFQDNWSLTDGQIQSILDWADSGARLDVPAGEQIVSTVDVRRLADPDLVLTPEVGFDGDESDGDRYRCLVYDPGLDEEFWIEAFEFVPDQSEVVHHAIGFAIDGSQRARVPALEAEDGEPGWDCYGGPRLGQSVFLDDLFMGWAPGQGPVHMPEGTGLRLGAGDFLVIQIHYHFDVDAPADHSALYLDFADPAANLEEIVTQAFVGPAEIPCTAEEEGPLCDRGAAMAAAQAKYGFAPADLINAFCGVSAADFAGMTDGIASSSCDWTTPVTGELVSVLGHEHELGKSFRMTLNPDTAGETVLLDIPKWDFDWQFNYYPVEKIMIQPGDTIRLECSWDRSLRDPDLEPAYVVWADGTDDEMCFATIAVRQG
jgi:hypothetical protein